ncbi:uncharacterized protein M6B38_341510 [Iris pallida]|uniref:Uncharacterized protein n=1 Tax=Iris pallida TaxID=29817 RepID=A0AAX6GY11_IRIPA|nr:uncharacterized protein M6B38_341510 [Iris pallida]
MGFTMILLLKKVRKEHIHLLLFLYTIPSLYMLRGSSRNILNLYTIACFICDLFSSPFQIVHFSCKFQAILKNYALSFGVMCDLILSSFLLLSAKKHFSTMLNFLL